MIASKVNNIDDYIAGFPEDVQPKLQLVRKTIKAAAPRAEETIKYAMPTFMYKGNLVYFAGYKEHIGFYPFPAAADEFRKESAKYKTGKGSIQFPLDQPMPVGLIKKIVKHYIKQNEAKALQKSKA